MVAVLCKLNDTGYYVAAKYTTKHFLYPFFISLSCYCSIAGTGRHPLVDGCECSVNGHTLSVS